MTASWILRWRCACSFVHLFLRLILNAKFLMCAIEDCLVVWLSV